MNPAHVNTAPDDPMERARILARLARILTGNTTARRTITNQLVGAAANPEDLAHALEQLPVDHRGQDLERARQALRHARRMWTSRAHRDAGEHTINLGR